MLERRIMLERRNQFYLVVALIILIIIGIIGVIKGSDVTRSITPALGNVINQIPLRTPILMPQCKIDTTLENRMLANMGYSTSSDQLHHFFKAEGDYSHRYYGLIVAAANYQVMDFILYDVGNNGIMGDSDDSFNVLWTYRFRYTVEDDDLPLEILGLLGSPPNSLYFLENEPGKDAVVRQCNLPGCSPQDVLKLSISKWHLLNFTVVDSKKEIYFTLEDVNNNYQIVIASCSLNIGANNACSLGEASIKIIKKMQPGVAPRTIHGEGFLFDDTFSTKGYNQFFDADSEALITYTQSDFNNLQDFWTYKVLNANLVFGIKVNQPLQNADVVSIDLTTGKIVGTVVDSLGITLPDRFNVYSQGSVDLDLRKGSFFTVYSTTDNNNNLKYFIKKFGKTPLFMTQEKPFQRLYYVSDKQVIGFHSSSPGTVTEIVCP